MLDSYDNLSAGGKSSVSFIFDTIIHITLLKYFKSLVICDFLFKQTSKKEDPSICFRSASLENLTLEHGAAVLSDFECHSPFALLLKKLNGNNNRRVSSNKRYHQVAVSSLEAIRRIFGVRDLSYVLLQTELLMCIMIGLQRDPVQDIKPSHWIKLITLFKIGKGR